LRSELLSFFAFAQNPSISEFNQKNQLQQFCCSFQFFECCNTGICSSAAKTGMVWTTGQDISSVKEKPIRVNTTE